MLLEKLAVSPQKVKFLQISHIKINGSFYSGRDSVIPKRMGPIAWPGLGMHPVN